MNPVAMLRCRRWFHPNHHILNTKGIASGSALFLIVSHILLITTHLPLIEYPSVVRHKYRTIDLPVV